MTSTIIVRPAAAAALDRIPPPDLHPIRENDSSDQKRSRSRSPSRSPPGANPTMAYPAYPGLQTCQSRSRTDYSRSADMALNRPRKLSGTVRPACATPAGGYHARDSTAFSHPRQTPGHHHVHRGTWRTTTAAGYMTTRTPPVLKRVSRAPPRPPRDVCAALAPDVLELILEMLKQLHLGKESDGGGGGGGGGVTGWTRDAAGVALCSRTWYEAARVALYQDIYLTGRDLATHKKNFGMAQSCRRLTLLRRTLRADAELASMVRSLRLPAPWMGLAAAATAGAAKEADRDGTLRELELELELEQYENVAASVVMACPNLERLHGPPCAYSHPSFRRLLYALSTRPRLQSMDWLVGSAVPAQHDQETAFLEHHAGWTQLARLSIQCLPRPGADAPPPLPLARTLTLLPALQHLHLHGPPPTAFDDATLLRLPPLRTLVLSHTGGISSRGLAAFASQPNSQALRRLVLRHIPLSSLPALARLLSHLSSLTSLALVQASAPLMPVDSSDAFVLCMMPYLASPSLGSLHWDMTSVAAAAAADDVLAASIKAGGFPRLRLLRAPNDPHGLFQDLCRPVAGIVLPGDGHPHRYRSRGRLSVSSASADTNGAFPPPPRPLSKSCTTSSLPPPSSPAPRYTNLLAARLAAQARLDRARRHPAVRVTVADEHGALVDESALGGYMGTLGSKIEYNLVPDEGATDEHGGLHLAHLPIPHSDVRSYAATETSTQVCDWSTNQRPRTSPPADRKGGGGEKQRGRWWWCTSRGVGAGVDPD